MKRLLSLKLLFLFAISSNAIGITETYIEVDGINYQIYKESHEAYVSSKSNKYSGDIIIPEEIKNRIGEKYKVIGINRIAFDGCTELTTISLPNSIITIGERSFANCSKLSSVTIPYGVTSIGSEAFASCTKLSDISIPDNVFSIGKDAFNETVWYDNQPDGFVYAGKVLYQYKGAKSPISSIILREGTVGIADGTLSGFDNLTSATLPTSLIRIGASAFEGCSKLQSLVIPNSVTTIGTRAFWGCIGLTTVTIPESVMQIGGNAFEESGITEVSINSNTILSNLYTSRIFPKDQIERCFIGGTVNTIGSGAFRGWNNLASVSISDNVTTIEEQAFRACPKLVSIVIPNSVTSIGSYVFEGCSGLASIIIPNSITTIPVSAFANCSNLTSVILPESINDIKLNAFTGCAQLKSLDLPDNITSIAMALGNIDYSCFDQGCKLYVNKGTATLFALWSAKYTPYIKGGKEKLKAPVPSVVSCTYTTAKCKIENFDEDYAYKYSKYNFDFDNYAKDVSGDEFTIDCLRPGDSCERYLRVIKNDAYYECKIQITTKSFTPTINVDLKSPTSIAATIKNKTNDEFELVNKQTAICSRTEVYKRDPKPDRTFYYQDKNEYWWYVYSIEKEGEIIEGDNLLFTGLNPSKTYYIVYKYEVNYNPDNSFDSYESNILKEVTTGDLTLVTEQPKVVSKGNVVVAATTNINESESNVGFEWRREDWGDSFASKTGKAYIFNGTMEGYIQNLNTEKLWKCRAYYLSKSGTYYYGDWVGIDPTDFSFFEPTVHTYTNIIATGNTASVKGYALSGSDEIAQQGFMYWKVDAAATTRSNAGVNVPDNAHIVEAKGQVMSVTLSSLEYDSQYSVVAFVTTSNGNTFYGEERSFTTETAPTGIEVKDINNNDNDELNIVAYYDVNGHRISKLQKGLNIVRMKDGTAKKVLVK